MNKQAEIEKYMQKLGISYAEAVQLMEDDEEDYIGEEGEELTKKAKANNTTERVQSEKRKKVVKERKVDKEKGYILNCLHKALDGIDVDNVSIKTETEISFTFNDNSYTLKLTKHRPPKRQKGSVSYEKIKP